MLPTLAPDRHPLLLPGRCPCRARNLDKTGTRHDLGPACRAGTTASELRQRCRRGAAIPRVRASAADQENRVSRRDVNEKIVATGVAEGIKRAAQQSGPMSAEFLPYKTH